MAHAERDLLPKTGKVNEMCREWLVREDGALAYRLQSQEINEHYKGNKQRNALVREDFPRALNEQLQEQQLAEQAARVYHQMLEEQERIDSEYARELAQKLEWEEKIKRQALQMQDQLIASQMHDETPFPVRTQYSEIDIPNLSHLTSPTLLRHSEIDVLNSPGLTAYTQHSEIGLPNSPQLVSPNTPPRNQSEHWSPNNYHCHTPRRQAKPMPLPSPSRQQPSTSVSYENFNNVPPDLYAYADPLLDTNASQETYGYSEVYRSKKEFVDETRRDKNNDISDDLSQLRIADLDVSIEEIRRQIQERKDAELARELQEKENCIENSQVDRDRLMAIEAQDKELAKLLQERERQKVKRARERAKQKSLMKKQQQMEQAQMNRSVHQDESYSDPVDLLQPSPLAVAEAHVSKIQSENPGDDVVSYSFPIDMVKGDSSSKQKSPFKDSSIKNHDVNKEDPNLGTNTQTSPARPTNLSLKPSARYPPHEKVFDLHTPSESPSKQLSNIAMAIDPTYNRRSQQFSKSQGSPSIVNSNTSTSSSSPSMYDDENSPVPPYMPIQGQRRTASLEKKHKKKVKDGCKQQ